MTVVQREESNHMTNVDPQIYWNDRLTRRYTLDGVGYIGLGVAYNSWMYRLRRHIFIKEIRRYLPHPEAVRVLDVGSGTGFYVDLWHELRAGHVTGSDLTEVAVGQLRSRHPGDDFVQFDVGGTHQFQPEEFGAVSMMDILYHIVDDTRFEQAFVNAFEVLAPGGLLIFSENFVRHDAVRIPHQASRTKQDIEKAVTAAGFEVLARRPVFFLMNAPIDSKSRVHARWWRSLQRTVRRNEAIGWGIGALLYPIELGLVSWNHEGPSTELMICRRPG
jgi:SAM-dependent methyltransferase